MRDDSSDSTLGVGVRHDKPHSCTLHTHEFFTFPSNPIDFAGTASAPSANSADAAPTTEPIIVDGQSFGPYNDEENAAQPDYVAAYTDSGELGYIKAEELDAAVDSGVTLEVVASDKTPVGVLTVK
jgi:hypothetical protein